MLSRKQTILAAPLVLLLLVGVWSAVWLYAARTARVELEEWAADRRSKGWTVSYGELAVGGYPFALDLRLDNPMLIDPTGMGWLGPAALHAKTTPIHPRTIHLKAPGKHVVTMAAQGQGAAALTIDAPTALGTVTLNDDGSAGRVEAVFADADVGGTKVASAKLMLDGFGKREAEHTVPTLHVSFAADTVRLAQTSAPVLGHDLTNLSIDATVQGGLPSDALATALAEWRDAGGTVEVRHASLNWGPLLFKGEGTVALDARLQPMLGGTATVSGFNETVDLFEKADLLSPDGANMARLAVSLLAKPAADGGPPVVTLPVTVQGGKLFAGPVELLNLPVIPWPGLDKSAAPQPPEQ